MADRLKNTYGYLKNIIVFTPRIQYRIPKLTFICYLNKTHKTLIKIYKLSKQFYSVLLKAFCLKANLDF